MQANSKQRITVGNLKGGVGRSTTAVHFAFELARSGDPVMLIDADERNGTTWEWSEDAGESWPSNIVVNFWPSMNLAKRVRESGHDGHLVIETSRRQAPLTLAAMTVAGFAAREVHSDKHDATAAVGTLATR